MLPHLKLYPRRETVIVNAAQGSTESRTLRGHCSHSKDDSNRLINRLICSFEPRPASNCVAGRLSRTLSNHLEITTEMVFNNKETLGARGRNL